MSRRRPAAEETLEKLIQHECRRCKGFWPESLRQKDREAFDGPGRRCLRTFSELPVRAA